MIDYSRSKELFLKIYPQESLQKSLEEYIKKHERKILKYLKLCYKNRWELHLKKDNFTKLCLVYAYLPEVKSRYEKAGISDEIFFDTMTDIKIWIDDCRENLNSIGLNELNWIMWHMNMSIFKIGRLQYQKMICYTPKSYTKNGTTIKLGDKIWNVHIPRGEKLTTEACEESFKMAQEFIRKHFPQYPDNKFMCNSWLLYPDNKNFMPSGSNILKFPELWEVVSIHECPEQAYRWLYSVRYSNKKLLKNKKKHGHYGFLESLPQNTQMQKNGVEYIKNGGTLGDGLGLKIL